MTCNTVTCTGYSADVLGAAVLIQEYWLKNGNGDLLSWFNFGEDSSHFAGTAWIGILLKSVALKDTVAATLQIFECNNVHIDSKSLVIPAGMSWAKWVFTGNFGQTCNWSVTRQSSGTGTMPYTPPPLP